MKPSSSTLPSLPEAVSSGALSVLDGQLSVLDGQPWSNANVHTTTAGDALTDNTFNFKPPIDRPRKNAGHVLVVDDNPQGRDLVKLVLHREQIAVEVAVNGEQALQRDLSGVKLILLDLNLPKLDGEATARILRGRGFTGAIVAYTGAESSKARLERVGFTDYLSKDSPIRQLIAVCRRYFPVETPTIFSGDSSTINPVDSSTVHPVDSSTIVPVAPTGERFTSSRRRELQRSYVKGLYESIDVLRHAVDTASFQQAEAIAHRLAGTGGLYDLPVVSDCGRRLYDAIGRSALPAEMDAMIDQLEIQADRAACLLHGTIWPR